jgi:hypothetical protein
MSKLMANEAYIGFIVFGLIGLFFGGLSRWVAWRAGQAAGGFVGRAVTLALRLDSESLSAAVAGGVDGMLFLGAVGLIVGLVGGPEGVLYGAVALVGLSVGAMLFGGLAYLLVLRRFRALTMLGGIMIGAFVGARITNYGLVGILAGAFAGLAFGGLGNAGDTENIRESHEEFGAEE